ncbi:MAG: hypothetical protein LBN24_05375 [Mediterranea sp.]|jgi:hypothetical protein|nr:hypothetical protein [Mediterranea sp.]
MNKNIYLPLLCLLLLLCGRTTLTAQALSEKYAPLLTLPKGYVCYRTTEPIHIDGQAKESVWKKAPSTDAFMDIQGEGLPKPIYRTTAKMLWDDDYLYIYAELEEPHVKASLHQRDTIVFYDNDFEVFIDPKGEGHNYFEIETNAIGTVFDLALARPYRAPRRPFIQFQWNCPGLKLATHIDGKLNDAQHTDKGWSVEMAIPRKAIASEFDNYLQAGSWLRLNFSRVEWLGKPEENWVWSPQGKIDMHRPERWGYVYLSEKRVGEAPETFRYPADQAVKQFLWMLFYAQEEHQAETGSYYPNLQAFGLSEKDKNLLPAGYKVQIEATSHTYEMIASTSPYSTQYVIDEEGRCFARPGKKLPVYAWQGWGEHTNEQSLQADFSKWKAHGVTGVCFNVGFDETKARTAARVAKSQGLEFHAWMPCMLHAGLPASWYAVNRLGESAHDVQAYVPYYTCLDPRNPEVQQWLIEQYSRIAAIPEVDYVQLDYVRYPDVILARGLWDKYGLVMNEEYPKADYCYCDSCVAAFKAQTGIDIRKEKDPSKCKEWAQFRCDVITDFVNKLAEAIHRQGKKVSADVFPGPHSYATWMVRQEWDKWKIDAFFPMNYNDFYLENAAWVGKVTREEVESVEGQIPVYSGLFICKDWRNKDKVIDPENSGLLPSEMKEAVTGAVEAGVTGIALFTPESMTDEHWAALKEVCQGLAAPL